MTLTQLSAFVLVARLGSVRAAANALDVSEPAVSQALSALRHQFDDPLIERVGGGMSLTPGGQRLLPIASQMVALGADADAAVRAGRGAATQLRVIGTSTLVEFVLPSLVDAFAERAQARIDTSFGVAGEAEMPVLLANRMADLAIGPDLSGNRTAELFSEPVCRARMVLVGPPALGPDRTLLVDSSGTEQTSSTRRLLRALRVAEERVRVFPNQTAAWSAAASGAGLAPAVEHLVAGRVRRGELRVIPTPVTPMEASWHASTLQPERRSAAADAFLHFLHTAPAMRLMREPGAGVRPSRFRPPVYVTIWS
ncbi:MAG TPA: LysR family transcriptional regulator [Pseudonocardiaceae bacterium]|jgi:DNA-binding transcriptional LysR family regulator|nr:LysR family transcriptional regulator [Pseudonocardiaceae bacterium]